MTDVLSCATTRSRWRAAWRRVEIAGRVVTVALPVVVWAMTGSIPLPGAIAVVELLALLTARRAARAAGLPGWSASEAYLVRLRRWWTAGRTVAGGEHVRGR